MRSELLAFQRIGRPEEVSELPANRFVADFIRGTDLSSARIARQGALSRGFEAIPTTAPLAKAVTLAVWPGWQGQVAEPSQKPGHLGPLRMAEKIDVHAMPNFTQVDGRWRRFSATQSLRILRAGPRAPPNFAWIRRWSRGTIRSCPCRLTRLKRSRAASTSSAG